MLLAHLCTLQEGLASMRRDARVCSSVYTDAKLSQWTWMSCLLSARRDLAVVKKQYRFNTYLIFS